MTATIAHGVAIIVRCSIILQCGAINMLRIVLIGGHVSGML